MAFQNTGKGLQAQPASTLSGLYHHHHHHHHQSVIRVSVLISIIITKVQLYAMMGPGGYPWL